jgi:internalin A
VRTFTPITALVLLLALIPALPVVAARPRLRRAVGWFLSSSGAGVAVVGVALAARNDFLDLRIATISWRTFVTASNSLAPLGLVVGGAAAALAGVGLLRRRETPVTVALLVVAGTAAWFATSRAAGIYQAARHVGAGAIDAWNIVGVVALLAALAFACAVAVRRRRDRTWTADTQVPADGLDGPVPGRATSARRRTLVIVTVIAVAVVGVGIVAWRGLAPRVVLAEAFPDPTLASCVARTMGEGGAAPKVSQRALDDVLTLTCEGLGRGDAVIRDLRGLELLPNLAGVNLTGNAITDLAPLAGHQKLSTLKLTDNELSDLSGLANLPVLNDLGLSRNRISDVTPLAQLPSLRHLGLAENEINDLTPLSTASQLATLDVSRNRVSDIEPLASLEQLDELTIADNEIVDLAPVAALPALSVLEASGNQVTAPPEGFPALRELWLGRNPVQDVNALVALPELAGVDLSDVDTTKVRGLDDLRASEIYVGGLA